MITIEDIISEARESITDCGSEYELRQKIEKIRSALVNTSESHKQLSNIIFRLNKILSDEAKGINQIEYYDTQLNRIQNSATEIISSFKFQDISTPFKYVPKKGIIYLIHDHHGEFRYEFSGSLSNGKPDGRGKVIYPNGDYFEGEFKNGLRNGLGTLTTYNNKITTGIWKNDEFYWKDTIDYYPDISVAANVLKGSDNVPYFEPKKMLIPDLDIPGLIALPIVGDSMLPTFSESDIVVCSQINKKHEIENNKPYVIFHDGDLVLKIVQKVTSKDDSLKLLLISENYIKYHPFEIEPDEYTKIFKIVLQIKKYN